MSNYVDPATIDSINKARKDPASLVKKVKPGQEMTTDQEKAQNIEKNKKRIAKMKEMYSMFLKMERGEETGGEESEQTEPAKSIDFSEKNPAANPAF